MNEWYVDCRSCVGILFYGSDFYLGKCLGKGVFCNYVFVKFVSCLFS